MSDWEKNEEIQLFREYLRIPSVHPNVDYGNDIDLEIFKLKFFITMMHRKITIL